MSVQSEHPGSGETLHPDIDDLTAGFLPSALECLQRIEGEIIVLWVSGEIDLCTLPILHAALDGCLDQHPAHLVVDLARMTFCSMRGLDLLTQTGRIATEKESGYAVTGVLPHIHRIWTLGWDNDRPICYRSTAAAITGIHAAESNAEVNDRGRPLATHPDVRISSSDATDFPDAPRTSPENRHSLSSQMPSMRGRGVDLWTAVSRRGVDRG